MRTTINIDDDLYRRAKAHAARTGRTVSAVIEDAVREALRRGRSQNAPLRELPSYGIGGTLPGVDLNENSALRDLMDEGESISSLQ